MISDAEGAKRFEVSLLLIILLVLFTGTSSVSSFHSRSACAPLHVIRQFRSNFPFKQVRGLAYPFFIRVRKVCTSTVRPTHRYAPNFYTIFIQAQEERKKRERAILLTHSPRLQKTRDHSVAKGSSHTSESYSKSSAFSQTRTYPTVTLRYLNVNPSGRVVAPSGSLPPWSCAT